MKHRRVYVKNRNHFYSSGKDASYITETNHLLEIPIDAYELILASLGILNFEADVLESTYSRALLPMIFVISIFELTKTARSALKVEKQVGSFTC